MYQEYGIEFVETELSQQTQAQPYSPKPKQLSKLNCTYLTRVLIEHVLPHKKAFVVNLIESGTVQFYGGKSLHACQN